MAARLCLFVYVLVLLLQSGHSNAFAKHVSVDFEPEELPEKFEEWQSLFGYDFGTTMEASRRFECFTNNYHVIRNRKTNAQTRMEGHTAIYGLDLHAALCHEEFRKRLGHQHVDMQKAQDRRDRRYRSTLGTSGEKKLHEFETVVVVDDDVDCSM